jgi:GxxExxY protein
MATGTWYAPVRRSRDRKLATKDTKDTKGIEMEGETLTHRILGCAVKVHKTLGIGFLEKVYENALVHELKKAGLFVEQQKPLAVYYDGIVVGDYVADIIVENSVVLELKAVSAFASEHMACCMNYLRATNLPVCLLINFGKMVIQVKRVVGDSYIDYPVEL